LHSKLVGRTVGVKTNKYSEPLTMTDQAHLAALQRYWKRHRAFPAMAKLCEVVGLSSTASVFGMVGRMTDAGYLERLDGRIAPGRRFFARPLLGPVRAGLPQPATQEQPEVLTLDDYLIDEPDRTTLHKVRGDSMRDAGIFDGDLVVVEHNGPTQPGDIVVAVVDDEMTVKTLALGPDGKYFLEPANPAFQPIHPKASLELLGVVISVARRVRR
jgi:repressor LexA